MHQDSLQKSNKLQLLGEAEASFVATDARSRRRHSSNEFDSALAALRNYDAMHQDSLQKSNKLQLLGEAEASFVATDARSRRRHSSSKLDSALAALRNCQL